MISTNESISDFSWEIHYNIRITKCANILICPTQHIKDMYIKNDFIENRKIYVFFFIIFDCISIDSEWSKTYDFEKKSE